MMYQFIIFIFIRCIIPKNTEEGGNDTNYLPAFKTHLQKYLTIQPQSPLSICSSAASWGAQVPGKLGEKKKTYNRACNYEKRRIIPPNKADSYSSLLSQNELQGKDLEKKIFLCDHPHITKRLTIFREKKLTYV